MTLNFLDLLRATVLFEIAVVLVFSVASITFYVKRLRSSAKVETGLSWHVVIVASAFLVLTMDRMLWVHERFGVTELHPRLLVYLIAFGAAGLAKYLLYAIQIKRFRDGR